MSWKCTRNASTSQPLCEELFLTRDHVILYLLNSVNLQNNCFWEVLFFFLYGLAKWSSIWAWRWRLHESSLTLAFSCLCVNCHCPLAVVTAEVHITDLHICLSLEGPSVGHPVRTFFLWSCRLDQYDHELTNAATSSVGDIWRLLDSVLGKRKGFQKSVV